VSLTFTEFEIDIYRIIIGIHDAQPLLEVAKRGSLREVGLLRRGSRPGNVVAPRPYSLVCKVHGSLGDHRLAGIDNERELGVTNGHAGIDRDAALRLERELVVQDPAVSQQVIEQYDSRVFTGILQTDVGPELRRSEPFGEVPVLLRSRHSHHVVAPRDAALEEEIHGSLGDNGIIRGKHCSDVFTRRHDVRYPDRLARSRIDRDVLEIVHPARRHVLDVDVRRRFTRIQQAQVFIEPLASRTFREIPGFRRACSADSASSARAPATVVEVHRTFGHDRPVRGHLRACVPVGPDDFSDRERRSRAARQVQHLVLVVSVGHHECDGRAGGVVAGVLKREPLVETRSGGPLREVPLVVGQGAEARLCLRST
jgi:hypothetical protein